MSGWIATARARGHLFKCCQLVFHKVAQCARVLLLQVLENVTLGLPSQGGRMNPLRWNGYFCHVVHQRLGEAGLAGS